MGVGILAPTEIVHLLFREDGFQLVGKFCLGGGFYQLHRLIMQLQHGLAALVHKVTAAQQLINAVADVSKTQIGHFLHPGRLHVHIK